MMMTTSNQQPPQRLYVYLQRPDNAEWVVVGRYTLDAAGVGRFIYAPSYLESGAKWPIDPVNLPLIPGMEWIAQRYAGLHDILRDACPDAWGQALIRRNTGLGVNASPVQYLIHSGNGERWGALAVGTGKKPNLAGLASPRIDALKDLLQELLAIASHQPPINPAIRKRLFASSSLGGARPKLTVRDGKSYWLAKPTIHTDVTDIAQLEAATQQWGSAAGLNFAQTRYQSMLGSRGVVLVRRFDREGEHRWMTASAASLLGVQYPPSTHADLVGASYPRLAEELQRIGCPVEDRIELFGRMIFNAMVGNDDDHCRNHAVLYSGHEAGWRLSPAFDVVPSTDDTPGTLQLQLCRGSRDISRATILRDHRRFGFADESGAARYLDALIDKICHSFEDIKASFPADMLDLMAKRLLSNKALLRHVSDSDCTAAG